MNLLKRVIKRLLLSRNAIISRPPGQFEICEHRLDALRRNGLKVSAAVDAGAANGEWTRMFHRVYPKAKVLCIEPRESCQSVIAELASRNKNVRYSQALLGSTTETRRFFENGNQSSCLRNASGDSFGDVVEYPMRRLDDVIFSSAIPWPELIKLDLQGAELDCLEGAPLALARAEAVLLEVSLIPLYKDTPLCSEVMLYMDNQGYRLYDIVGLLRRPLDTALAQGDFLFVKKTNPILANPRWDKDAAWS